MFVYKQIAAGSIEEKILALQEKNATLTDSIPSEGTNSTAKFSVDDLDALFEAISEISPAKEAWFCDRLELNVAEYLKRTTPTP